MSDNWEQHRKRWWDRIQLAERKASIIEAEVNSILDDIDEGKITDVNEVNKLMCRALKRAASA